MECNFTSGEIRYPNDGRLYCNATFDGFQCWNYTLAGETAVGKCPSTHPESRYFITDGISYRQCNRNGDWWKDSIHGMVYTDYRPCVHPDILSNVNTQETKKTVIYVYISGFVVSIVMLVVALAIFTMNSNLHCSRTTIHKQLFVSYILSSCFWILSYSLVALHNVEIMDDPMWCYFLHVITQYTTVCNYAWMMAEGIFLHSKTVIVFCKDRTLLVISCVIGWVQPALIVGVYVLVRAFSKNTEYDRCWKHVTDTIWIIFAPVLLMLLVNLFFLSNILRVIVLKLKTVPRKGVYKCRIIARDCFVLIPLLGIQFLFFPVTLDSIVYEIIEAVCTSYQGAVVAVLFCFVSKDLRNRRKFMDEQ